MDALFDQVNIHGVDHFTSLHAPSLGEPQPVSFFDCDHRVPSVKGTFLLGWMR